MEWMKRPIYGGMQMKHGLIAFILLGMKSRFTLK